MHFYLSVVPRMVAALALLFALSGCDSASDEGAGMGMMGGRGPVPVVVSPVRASQFIDGFSALGSLRANEAVEITARISSVVKAIHFEEGQHVKEGDLLIELDDREIAAEYGMSKAAYEKVRSQYQRSASLRETRVVSEAELDELAADVRRAEADMRAAQARLDDTTIHAPIDGIVGLRNVSRGGLVGTDTVITTLDDTEVMKLDFAVPERFLATVQPGMTVAASTDVYRDTAFSGQVTSIDSRIDPITRTVKVVATLPNDDDMLKPGMFMNVELRRVRENVLLIPEEALAPRAGRQYVFVVRDDVIAEQEVQLGARAPGVVEITEGLQAGDDVVVEGIQKVRNGSSVTIVDRRG